jgi:glycosyltransferase involved in cell wall biosynthesis
MSIPGHPFLSIISITMNNPAGLNATLESLLQFGHLPYPLEIIVIDGGDDHETLSVLGRFRERLPIVHHRAPDAGVYDAMNRGIELATGAYLQFLNAGDCFVLGAPLPQFLRTLKTASPHWAVSGAVTPRGNLGEANARIPSLPHVWWRHALGLQPHCHQATWFSSALVAVLGTYDVGLDFVADYDWILRAGLMSAPLQFSDVLIKYEGGGMSSLRGAEIASLLSAVRRQRFSISGVASAMDYAFTLGMRVRRALLDTRSKRLRKNEVMP